MTDTVTKRRAWAGWLPQPSGSISQEDRKAWVSWYPFQEAVLVAGEVEVLVAVVLAPDSLAVVFDPSEIPLSLARDTVAGNLAKSAVDAWLR